MAGEDIGKVDSSKDIYEKREDVKARVHEPTENEPKSDEKEIKKMEDEKIIVEADSDAIEAALKRHIHDEDSSFVEADEQTIIDKVLSQKKKGKWSKK